MSFRVRFSSCNRKFQLRAAHTYKGLSWPIKRIGRQAMLHEPHPSTPCICCTDISEPRLFCLKSRHPLKSSTLKSRHPAEEQHPLLSLLMIFESASCSTAVTWIMPSHLHSKQQEEGKGW